jgi:hypothetical protein
MQDFEEIKFENKSDKLTIEISLTQTEPKVVALPGTEKSRILKPLESGTLQKEFEGGCAKMFIWSAAKEIIWCGIIPLGGDTPILIYPEEKKVTYRGQILPPCFMVENFSNVPDSISENSVLEKFKTQEWYWYVILLFVIMAGGYLYFRNGTKKK